jgi:ABC-2 type transport system permease protein
MGAVSVIEAAPVATPRPPYRPATFPDILRSEWTKLRSVRSTYWALLVAAALGIGLGALISTISANHYATDPTIQFGWNPTDRSLRSLAIAQLAFAILGVMVVTGEYSTGMIRTSLAAVPKRSSMLAAKCLVFTTVALVAGEIVSFVTFLLGQALISGKAPSATLAQHNVLRAVVGAGLYLALLALLGSAFGVVLRHAAAAIGSVVAVLLVLPGIAAALPLSWSQPIERWWPTNAGQQVAMVARDSHTLAAWTGLGVMAAFVALVLGAGFVLLERRDA